MTKDELYTMRQEIDEYITKVKHDIQTEEAEKDYQHRLELTLRGLEASFLHLGEAIEAVGGELPKKYRKELDNQ